MPAKRGRSAGFQMSHEHRVKIQNSNILNSLIEHVEGKREMSATQVQAGLGLLRKVLPDLASVDHTGSVEVRSAAEMTDDEIAAIIAGSRARTAAQTDDPSQLH